MPRGREKSWTMFLQPWGRWQLRNTESYPFCVINLFRKRRREGKKGGREEGWKKEKVMKQILKINKITNINPTTSDKYKLSKHSGYKAEIFMMCVHKAKLCCLWKKVNNNMWKEVYHPNSDNKNKKCYHTYKVTFLIYIKLIYQQHNNNFKCVYN